MVVAGRLNKQIAGDLQLSEATVRHTAAKQCERCARSLAELVRMAER